MRKIHEILRLKFACGLSKRQIAASTGVGVTTVSDYLRRARRAGVSWPLPVGMSDDLLEARLFVPPSPLPAEQRPVPDWACVHRELRRPDVTLTLLWEEYRAQAPEGYGYSWFCDLYREWAGRLKPTMRQTHVAGDKLFVDFAGRTVDIVAGPTGAVRRAAIFVAVLGASSYTYAEAVWTQALPDWIGAHARTFTYLGGCPRLVVPDNLKSGITKACFYEPQVQRTYADMLRHYGVAPLPARPVKPRDKAKVEVGVQVIQRWILARLRNQVFHSLEQLNTAIRALLDELNDRMMRHLGVTRRQLFEQLDKPALRSLPVEPYVYAEWKRCRVGLDYHVEVDKHLYSVPCTLLRQEVEARVSTTTVEIFHRGKRVATHLRSPGRGPTTMTEHMPSSHRRYKDWTVERIQRDAASIGPASVALVGAILAGKPHPEQGFRAAVGILRLARGYGPERLEAACERALAIGARSYTSVHSILRNNLDRVVTGPAAEAPVLHHANIRGSRYYH